MRPAGGWLVTVTAVLLAFVSCKDELASPTKGTVVVSLSSSAAGGIAGTQVFEGDALIWTAGEDSLRELTLSAGDHTIRVSKPCTRVEPDTVQTIRVEAGHDYTLGFRLEPRGGIEVVTEAGGREIRGADVLVNGEATGLKTPATLTCVEGSFTISVNLTGFDPAPDTTVVAGSELIHLRRTLRPAAQRRGALLELYTATFCPNCWYSDVAAESLWTVPALVDSGFVGIQTHITWSGRDSLWTQSISVRAAQNGRPETSAPFCFINAQIGNSGAGSGENPVAQLFNQYRHDVHHYLDGAGGAAELALYWRDVQLVPGDRITGTIRVVLLQDIPDTGNVVVRGVNYKDGLVTIGFKEGRLQLLRYDRVARHYQDGMTLGALHISRAGEWADMPIEFRLSGDERWSEASMGVVAFAERILGSQSRDVLQVVHRRVTE